jgi:hypothetical protein
LAPFAGRAAEAAAKTKAALHLTAGQKGFLWLEPILVTVRVEGNGETGLPPGLDPGKRAPFRLKIDPPLKPRPKARPLPLEGQQAKSNVRCRRYDLSEWFLFPAEGGTWKVRAVYEGKGGTLTSGPITVTVRRPDKKDAEAEPVARLHHTPWSNYDTNAFCGDTFDLVKRWPKSRLARYCHYWNGRFLQNKKEYAKAIASYRLAAEQYPGFALADDAAYGVVECLVALKKFPEAEKVTTALRQRLKDRAAKSGFRGQTAVQGLAEDMAGRISRERGLK